MRIAIFKLFNIGDALLLTPTLTGIRQAYPSSEITVVTRETNLGILQGCPAIDRLVGMSDPRLRKAGWLARDIRSVFELRKTRFDYLFELGGRQRGRNLAVLCRARRSYSVRTPHPLSALRRLQFDAVAAYDGSRGHAVERDYFTIHEFLPLPPPPLPPLIFRRECAKAWAGADGLNSFGVLHVGSREGFKRWHAKGWRQVATYLLEKLSRLVVTTGPDAEEVAEAEALHDHFGPKIVLTRGQTTWPELADLLYRATLYVGLDTSMMHLAAACQCPIVTLWGKKREGEEHWVPWQAFHRIVFPHSASSTERRMHDVLAGDVIGACEEILGRV